MMIENNSPQDLAKKAAIKELWRRGELLYKLDTVQRELYKAFYESTHKICTWLLSRRQGKTYTLCVLALEQCIRQPNSIVKFVSPTKDQVHTNVRPILKQLLEDCPEEIKPEYRKHDYIYFFPNGSEIQLAGSEAGNAEKLRGGFSHISIIDEAQDVTDLSVAVKEVLLPTTLTTNGKVIIAGTPPKNADHDFIKFIEEGELRGSIVKKTVYDNVMLSKEQINEIMVEVGGENSEEFRREFLCHLIKDKNYSVIPEFTPELEKEIIKEWPKPPAYKSYVSMDLGFKDMTVVLFAYYDFKAAKIVIEDEIAVNGTDLQLPKLTADIKDKEEKLWTNILTNETIIPTSRVSDINYIVTQEIARASKGEIVFSPAKKDDKEAAINTLRVMLQSKKIIIHPRCTTLIRHLQNVRWDKSKNKNQFARSPDDGHYDAVDCCIYMIRQIDFKRNPYPFGDETGLRKEDLFVYDRDQFTKDYANSSAQADASGIYRKIFNIKPNKGEYINDVISNLRKEAKKKG